VNETQRITLGAAVLLVVLRLAIGWQLMYEGLWKIKTLRSPTPWTSAGFLKNSQGPLRGVFRNLTGDPDGLALVDYDTVAASWNDWYGRFNAQYQLSEGQIRSMDRLLNGAHSMVGKRKAYAEPLEALPPGIEDLNTATKVSKKVAWFDSKAKRLYVDGTMFMKPDEKARLEAAVAGRLEDKDTSDDVAVQAYLRAVGRVFGRQKKGMGYRDRLRGALKGNPGLVGNVEWQRLGKIDQYRQTLSRYETQLAEADEDFEWDHLQKTKLQVSTLRAEVTGPVKALDNDLKLAAQKLLTLEQRTMGPPSSEGNIQQIVDSMTIAGLTILGLLLILGLGTRYVAIAAAFMLFNFYMAMPPWPGVPEAPGPEHSFIINKNLIEVIALLGIALMPTGHWFGLDGVIGNCCGRKCADESGTATDVAADETATSEAEQEADESSSETTESSEVAT
jgi:uncharacterized membrane protein YphA (DoxX/SURF4 family)